MNVQTGSISNVPAPLSLAGITKTFGKKEVLKGVEFQLERGGVVGLLGSNGSGKTTMIKCAVGLLRATAGEAQVLGEPAWELSAEAKARIGYVPQEVASYPWMRVRHTIDYTAAFYPRWNDEIVRDLVHRWQLPMEDRVGTLSVGQLQSLGIILALGHEPELLILDEPVASLDPLARREFLRTLIELLDDPNRTVLFSTHITSDLERIAGRVAILRDGRIAYHGEMDRLKEQVKRLRITSRNPLPASFAVPGSLHCAVEGPVATVAVADYDEQLADGLRQEWDAEIAVTDLNLEEIFVEMHDE